MIYAAGGAPFEATLTGAPTGLVGTLGVQLTDGQGGTVIARSVAGIVEHPAGSGVYTATLTAPDAAGSYVLVWDDGAGTFTGEDVMVTSSAPLPPAAPVEAIVRLAAMVDAAVEPTLTDAELADLLARNATLDAEGHLVTDADWTPTYMLGAAAEDGWLLKAGKAAARVDGADGGLRLSRSQLHAHCLAMAERYSMRRYASLPLAPVERGSRINALNAGGPGGMTTSPGDVLPGGAV